MTRIAQISSYPTRWPKHGGQIRAQRIALALEIAGYEVIRLPFFGGKQHKDQSESPIIDLSFADTRRRHPQIDEVIDLTLSELVATDDQFFTTFTASMEEACPDIVMLEEPWLWPAVRRWLSGKVNPPPVVFNSYNIESQAKAAILADTNYAEAGSILAEIEALERDLARRATGITATTEGDAKILGAWTDSPVAVARNGTAVRSLQHLSGVLPEPLKPNQRYLLFIGSAHPPNAAGFLSMAMPSLPMLRSAERIVLAGGVCQLLASKFEKQGPNAMLRDRTVFLGQVSSLALECLISNASGILLPITYGGGSNLKTAEALSSGLPIVGTSIAFRGFEEFRHLPQVTIADTPEEFAHAVRRTLQEKYEPQHRLTVNELHWESTLQPIVELMNLLTIRKD